MINLYINYFTHSDTTRRQEIEACLKFNLANKLIDRIIILSEGEVPFKDPKLVILPTNKQPTYQDFFNLTADYGAEDINIISNSDIGFNETLAGVTAISPNVCYALTRHEIRKGRPVAFRAANGCPPHFSQDTWVFKGPVKVSGYFSEVWAINTATNQHEKIPFTMGVPGCDNVLAHYLGRSYQLKNPHDIIQGLHYHSNGSRPKYSFRITGDRSRWGQLKKVAPSQL